MKSTVSGLSPEQRSEALRHAHNLEMISKHYRSEEARRKRTKVQLWVDLWAD